MDEIKKRIDELYDKYSPYSYEREYNEYNIRCIANDLHNSPMDNPDLVELVDCILEMFENNAK